MKDDATRAVHAKGLAGFLYVIKFSGPRYVYVHVYEYVCIYIHKCVYGHVYIYVYIYVYLYRC